MEKFFGSFLGRVVLFFFGAVVGVSLVLFAADFKAWFWSLWLTFGWLAVNSFFLNQLFETALTGERKHRKKIFMICLVKFPVLYGLGLWMLRWPPVKIEGVFFAFSLYILVLGALLAWGRLPLKEKGIRSS